MVKHGAKDIAIKNRLRKIEPLIVGPNQKMALIVTAGVTKNYSTIDKEVEKIASNLRYGISMINDVTVSSCREIEIFQEKLISMIDLPVKSVPGYELYLYMKENQKKIISKEDLLGVLRRQAERGIDAMTIHPFPVLTTIKKIKTSQRKVKLTARGGGLIYEYMMETGRQNPFYEYFNEIVKLVSEYGITLSFGQSFRPSCIADRPDKILDEEMRLHAKLIEKANQAGVKTMVEILGHVRLVDLGPYMKKARKLFPNSILTCMGPILTDISIGHDNITSAIGTVLAGVEGIDAIVNITPDEHIRIPQPESITEGIISHKIATHIVDTWKVGDVDRDLEIGRLRKLNKECFSLVEGKKYLIDPDNDRLDKGVQECTMCGDFCPRKKVE